MNGMGRDQVVNIRDASTPRARAQRRMQDLAAAARTAAAAAAAAEPNAFHPGSAGAGRAWLNGTELGRHDARYGHLTRAHE